MKRVSFMNIHICLCDAWCYPSQKIMKTTQVSLRKSWKEYIFMTCSHPMSSTIKAASSVHWSRTNSLKLFIFLIWTYQIGLQTKLSLGLKRLLRQNEAGWTSYRKLYVTWLNKATTDVKMISTSLYLHYITLPGISTPNLLPASRCLKTLKIDSNSLLLKSDSLTAVNKDSI